MCQCRKGWEQKAGKSFDPNPDGGEATTPPGESSETEEKGRNAQPPKPSKATGLVKAKAGKSFNPNPDIGEAPTPPGGVTFSF